MSHISGTREASLLEAVNLLLNARRTGTPLTDLPPELQPASLDEAAFVQDTLAQSFGEVGGWKIGAVSPEATPGFAPMPSAWIAPGGVLLRGRPGLYHAVECEVAFLLASDIPPRAAPYSLADVIPHIGSCHPVIEVLEPAFLDPDRASPLARLADLQMHGGLIYGPAFDAWQSVDFSRESVVLAIDGAVRVERTGSNPAGDLLRLLPFLATEGAARTGGLRAGQWITTGTWTGATPVTPFSSVDVRFSTLGRITARLE